MPTLHPAFKGLPRVGLGTWQTFDAGADAARRSLLAETLRAFHDAGGRMVDTSPMYGSAEAVLGDVMERTGLRASLFVATKVWTAGRADGERQMRASLAHLRTEHVELMQIHNLVDWRTHLPTLRTWQADGHARCIGLTHYAASGLAPLEAVVRQERVDAVQFALSLDEPAAAERLLALCAERGVAFIANRPFGEGAALARTRGKALPGWAVEQGLTTWPQFLLAWVLSHPEVTCAIPGTSRAGHARENVAVGMRPPVDRATRARMAAAWAAL